MRHTENYELNIIETSDPFGPDALNDNARTLEKQLARLDAADAALSADLGAIGANCRIVTGAYKGDGAGVMTLTLERHPEVLFVYGNVGFAVFFKNYSLGYVVGNDRNYTYNLSVTWGAGGKITWRFSSAGYNNIQMNIEGLTYNYIALYA